MVVSDDWPRTFRIRKAPLFAFVASDGTMWEAIGKDLSNFPASQVRFSIFGEEKKKNFKSHKNEKIKYDRTNKYQRKKKKKR